jgi:hypothetical protein
MSSLRVFAVCCAALALQGCLAKAAVGVVTLPVRAVGAGVDAVTTSESEADEKRGREIRQREERIAELEAEYYDSMERCSSIEPDACYRAKSIEAEIDELKRGAKAEPDGR